MAARAWKHDLPELASHWGFWEERDLKVDPLRWCQVDFDDQAWACPEQIGKPPCEPWVNLVERDIPLLELKETAQPALLAAGSWTQDGPASQIPSVEVNQRLRISGKVNQNGPWTVCPAPAGQGRYLTFDFGHTLSGYLKLRFKNPHAGSAAMSKSSRLSCSENWRISSSQCSGSANDARKL